jgi:hypothetical protein
VAVVGLGVVRIDAGLEFGNQVGDDGCGLVAGEAVGPERRATLSRWAP